MFFNLYFILFLINSSDSYKNFNFISRIKRSILHSNPENLNHDFYHYDIFPRLEIPNDYGQLTWYPIGFSKDFGKLPKQITIRDTNYIVWKDRTTYYGLRDCCSHQGSSFLLGKTNKNTISCPYHGYVFDGIDGQLVDIPKLPCLASKTHNIESFKVVEKGDMVYFNTIPNINDETKNKIDVTKIFIEPEYYDENQKVVYLSENFEHYGKFISVNSLDICHIGFVHTFGNKKNPNPISFSNIIKMNDTDNHYKIKYTYLAGKESLVNKVYNFSEILVENEYILPHTTVARVIFGPYTSTIITHALPISKFKTKLFVKAYRSYWSFDLNNNKNHNIFFPFLFLINKLGDLITQNTMYTTLKQDKSIVDLIDKKDYQSMHGKFSIIYDKFSNHYKNNYKKYYELNDTCL
jgi:phenylpropionate dioxygenase-like ring-hydroxylating dioxygenase large terminal subunit